MFLTAVCLVAMFAQDTPTPISGAELKSVQGPVAPRYPDPAGGVTADRMLMKIRRMARKGAVPSVAVPPGPQIIEDKVTDRGGWKGYRVEVAPQTTVHMRVRGEHEAWFTMRTVNRWGNQEPGMLQNRVPTGNPEASYINRSNQVREVFFIVDTTEEDVSTEPFTLHVTHTPGTEREKPKP